MAVKLMLLFECSMGTMDCLPNTSISFEESKHDLKKDDEEQFLECSKRRRLRSNGKPPTPHKKLQYDGGELHCRECDYSTSDSSSLYLHIRDHTDDRPFRCQHCPYASQSESILTVHTNSHILHIPSNILLPSPVKQPIEEPLTSESNTVKSVLQSEELTLKVVLNGNDAASANVFHSTEIAKSMQNAVRTEPSNEKKFRCDHAGCTYSTDAAISFKHHLDIHSNEKAFKCEMCQKSFRRSDHCHTHEKLHIRKIRLHCKHEMGASCTKCKQPLIKLLFRCLWCPFTCGSESQLVIHCRSPHTFKRNHTLGETVPKPLSAAEVEIKCDDFQETLKQNEESLLQDANVYLTENVFEFPSNDTEAPLASSVMVVESSSISSQVNSGTEVIPSEMANVLSTPGVDVSSFTTISTTSCSVKRPTKTRKNKGPTNEATSKKFKCSRPGCTFSSTYSKNLILHRLLIHSTNKTEKQQQHTRQGEECQSERPFQCKQCSKRFLRKRGLQLHERSHIHGFQHRCEKCDYGTQYLCNLKKHVIQKHGRNQ